MTEPRRQVLPHGPSPRRPTPTRAPFRRVPPPAPPSRATSPASPRHRVNPAQPARRMTEPRRQVLPHGVQAETSPAAATPALVGDRLWGVGPRRPLELAVAVARRRLVRLLPRFRGWRMGSHLWLTPSRPRSLAAAVTAKPRSNANPAAAA